MSRPARIRLNPVGETVEAAPGSALADALAAAGVEFPCGGRGACRGCRVRTDGAALPVTPADELKLSAAERAAGWRLACQALVPGDLTLELRQWAGVVLADESPFAFEPADGLGLAVDVGTTTVVAQLLDRATGRVLGTRTMVNPQARWGADVMSRLCSALAPAGRVRLTLAIRDAIGKMIESLLEAAPGVAPVTGAVLVGNTAMHHLFLGHDVTPLAGMPFEAREPGPGRLSGVDLAWPARARGAEVVFLPVLGGFVGSDILAVILATGLGTPGGPAAAADLGTNGELVVRFGDRIWVASTAAGPAFEGARIGQGMRAAAGAIDRVEVEARGFRAHVIGGGEARGLCGSGLVDAVACGLALGGVDETGRLLHGPLAVAPGVAVSQKDLRELQLAKGAIAAGLRILAEEAGLAPWPGGPLWLAGAFGNSLSADSARRIGLLPDWASDVRPAGNAALLGAKIALGMPGMGRAVIETLLPRITHVALERRPDFHDLFAEAMFLPVPAGVGGGTEIR